MTTITAEYHSIWDQGYDMETSCAVDLQTGLVTPEVSLEALRSEALCGLV